ncbi:MAG: hypothetical protein EBR55_04365 [Chitinophagia bacterium]|nr:hypothetical protein [Chitinophagia bacterium]
MFFTFEEYNNDFLKPQTNEKNNSTNCYIVHRILLPIKYYWKLKKRKRRLAKVIKRVQDNSTKR